jgi:hypothetical protein
MLRVAVIKITDFVLFCPEDCGSRYLRIIGSDLAVRGAT